MTVSELIEQLQKFDGSRLVILDDDGNTNECPSPELWDENDKDGYSPVALFI